MSVNTLGVLEGGITITAFCFKGTALRLELASMQEMARVAGETCDRCKGAKRRLGFGVQQYVVRSVRIGNILKLERGREREELEMT